MKRFGSPLTALCFCGSTICRGPTNGSKGSNAGLIHWNELHDGEQVDDASVLDRSASQQGMRFYRGSLD
jgi:hypothetical protein